MPHALEASLALLDLVLDARAMPQPHTAEHRYLAHAAQGFERQHGAIARTFCAAVEALLAAPSAERWRQARCHASALKLALYLQLDCQHTALDAA